MRGSGLCVGGDTWWKPSCAGRDWHVKSAGVSRNCWFKASPPCWHHERQNVHIIFILCVFDDVSRFARRWRRWHVISQDNSATSRVDAQAFNSTAQHEGDSLILSQAVHDNVAVVGNSCKIKKTLFSLDERAKRVKSSLLKMIGKASCVTMVATRRF